MARALFVIAMLVAGCAQRAPAAQPSGPPPPAGPAPPDLLTGWWCAQASSSPIGACSRTQSDCEAARASWASRSVELSACHPSHDAFCYTTARADGPSRRCAPDATMCEVAIRQSTTAVTGGCVATQ
jgi:hypothetical protein